VTTIHLIRHAKAKNRIEWTEADEVRPLTKRGRREADAIAANLTFEEPAPGRLVSSPYLRCVQTLEPLARSLDLPIETTDALAEGADADVVIELLLALAGHGSIVGCTHGDVVFEVADEVVRSGVPLDGPRDVPVASAWVFGVEEDRFVSARFVPQPPR
jgi:8-oxo-dGTP diphosphatase